MVVDFPDYIHVCPP